MLSGADRALPARAGLAAASAVVALPLAALLWRSGAISFPLALAATLLVAVVVLSSGMLALRVVGAADMPVPAAWVMGLFVTSLVLYALVEALGLLAFTAFAAWAAVVAALNVVLRRRVGAGRPMQAAELVALLFCGVASVLWCRDIAEAPEILVQQHLLAAWVDYYIHGGVISHFGDPFAQGWHSIDLAGFRKPFYHYASYLLPAVLAAPLDLPGLPLATSFWLPLGFFTMCAGAYALGSGLAGPAGGLAAIAVLALVPDASNYGLRNGFFSFHWNVLAVPGATYAIGVSLLSFAFLQRWSISRGWRPLLVSGCLAGGVLLFRAHVFGLAFPTWLASVALLTPLVQRRITLFLCAGAAGFVAFLIGFYTLTDFVPALELFLDNMHGLQIPTAYMGWYNELRANHGRGVSIPAGVVLVFPVALGLFTLLYPLSVFLAHRCGGLRAIDVVPAALIVCYVLVLIAAPIPGHGDPSELTHRPFVLFYAVVAIWTVAGLVRALIARGVPHVGRALLVAGGVGLVLVWPQTGMLGELPKFLWGWKHYPYFLHEGMPQAATYIRRSAIPGDLIAAQGLSYGWVSTDIATQLVGMTGVPAYIARPFIHFEGKGPRHEVALKRYFELKQVAAEASVPDALARLRELGVSWYVVVGKAGPLWDPARGQAAFSNGEVAVYSTRLARP